MVPLVINDVPIQCINRAAVEYHVPAILIISVLKTENGHAGSANKNKNGTYDLGCMQINSAWLPELARYGFTEQDVQYDPCKNVEVGAWILSTSIASEMTLQRGVGDYHSHTEYYNVSYSEKVFEKLNHLENVIGV